jgi:hypothetical protein
MARSSTFKTVPDAPITSFELKLPTGNYSILGANGDVSLDYEGRRRKDDGDVNGGGKICESEGLAMARVGVIGRLRARQAEIERAIFTKVRQVPGPVGGRDAEYLEGLCAAVKERSKSKGL